MIKLLDCDNKNESWQVKQNGIHRLYLWMVISSTSMHQILAACLIVWKNVKCSDLEVNYESERKVRIVYSALDVDKEVW